MTFTYGFIYNRVSLQYVKIVIVDMKHHQKANQINYQAIIDYQNIMKCNTDGHCRVRETATRNASWA